MRQAQVEARGDLARVVLDPLGELALLVLTGATL